MYIYENKDWPNFTWNKEIISNLLCEVKRSQGYLLGKMENLGFDVKNQASLQILTETVIKSSEIEGEIFNASQVRSSVARKLGIKDESVHCNDKNIDGAVEIIIDAVRHYNKAITAERLFCWHAALFPTGYSGMYKVEVGHYRTDFLGRMQIISGYLGRERIHYEAPKASYINYEMNKFLNYLNDDKQIDHLIKAAIIHLWFVTIHPFEDGNGRIVRALTETILAKSDNCKFRFYSIASQIMDCRKEYYDILEKTQKGSMNITDWIAWFLQNVQNAILASEATLANIINAYKFWQKNMNIEFNNRQKIVLKKLLDNFIGNLTSSKWAKLCKCSQDTASRDLNDLIKKKILRKVGQAKNTHYVLMSQNEF